MIPMNGPSSGFTGGLNRSPERRKRGRETAGRKTAYKPAGSVAPQLIATTKRSRKRKADAAAAPSPTVRTDSAIGTPLQIPYGNKDIAMKLGARYGAGGMVCPSRC
jgi:DNA topoisomerase III